MIRVRCPICEKTIAARARRDIPHVPFCSRRGELAHLGRWLDESYVAHSPMDPDSRHPGQGDAMAPGEDGTR